MALALIQRGTGGALCVYASPLPDRGGVPDATTAPSMPAATLAALGPVPCVVGTNARGTETPEEILAFARARTGRALWWAALIGVSRGCQRVRDLWMAGAAALALILVDGMAGQKPPTPTQLGFAQTAVALARSGAILLVVSHTYISQGPKITSTAEMARLATGWALPAPPVGETVRRVQAPAEPASGPATGWRGGLVVYSTGSGPSDGNAHRDQMARLLPVVLADRVRPLVDLPERPDVATAPLPETSPEPGPEAGPWSHLGAASTAAPTAAPTSAPTAAPTSAPTSAPDAPRVLLIGDSLAEGLGPPLAKLAEKAGIVFAYQAMRGWTIQNWLDDPSLPATIAKADPSVGIVCLGTNDMLAAKTAQAAAEGQRAAELVAVLRRNGVGSVRWIAPPAMPFDRPEFREALNQACSARGVRVFDAAAVAPPLERAGDKIHLTRPSYQRWAELVAAWVPFQGLAAQAPAAPPPPPARVPPPARGTPAAPLGPLPGARLPLPRPRAPGEGRTTLDPTDTLGERAAQFSLEEERDGVREDPPGSNRSPRIDAYRRGMGTAGDNWCAWGFCYAGYSALQPGEELPHAYTGRVADLIKTGQFHRKDDGYRPHVGDGAIFRRGGQDPTAGGNGHIGRVLVLPDAAGDFESIEANSGNGWAERVHNVGDPAFLGWLAYPQGKASPAPGVPDSIVVEDMGRLPFEEYVARVVTGEFGQSHELEALKALALAARTYAVWMMRHEGLGTEKSPMPNATKKQVVAGRALPLAAEATRATRGGLILHKHEPILACHNAGAIWLPGALTGAGGKDPSGTEKNITYNGGRGGRQVKPTPIARANAPGNRGCLSQNGADELARQGRAWPEILRWFYGRDIDFSIPEPASPRPGPPPPSARPGGKPSSDDGDLLLPVLAGLGLAAAKAFG